MNQKETEKKISHIKVLLAPWPHIQGEEKCTDCATSCQSACKTSCTVGNIPCEKRR